MRIRDFLERHGWLIAIAAAYLYIFPAFPKIRSANELPRIYLVQAIVDDHTFAIDKGVARWGATVDVSPSRGHHYSNKAPGSSMLAAPAYLVAKLVVGPPSLGQTLWLARVFGGIIPMLLFLGLLSGFLVRFAPDPAVRRLVLVAYALGSLAMTYSVLFYSHQLGAICVGAAWILGIDVAERRRGRLAMIAAGAVAGAAALVDYQAVFAVVPVAIHILVKLWRWPRAELARSIALAVAGAAVPIAILLAYHAVCFGSPWRTGYDASETFAHYHQQGFLGITQLRGEAFWGSLVRPDNGLLILAPWLLLAIPGAVVLARGPARRDRGTVAVGVSVAVIYVLFISSINFWRGGWQVGPRYITAMLPFLLPLIAAQLQWLVDRAEVRRSARWLLATAAGSIVVGVVIYALTCATFPYWPDSLRHPLYDVTFRLLADDLAAPSLGSALGVGGVAGLVPYFLVVFGVLGWAIQRVAGWRGLVASLAIGAAVVVAYGAFAHGGPETDRPYRFVRSAVIER
ncbi:MAG: hypothetical protein M3680_19230 [Myxococcota bacterium]|nr:hypothetical protein [Myxococcota bacterium]